MKQKTDTLSISLAITENNIDGAVNIKLQNKVYNQVHMFPLAFCLKSSNCVSKEAIFFKGLNFLDFSHCFSPRTDKLQKTNQNGIICPCF